MENRDLRKRLTAFAAAVMMTGTAFAANPYILDDFENTDKGADVMNYNNGAWYLYDDNAPAWDKKTYDKDAVKFTDENGMLPGGDSRFTKMNDKEITEADMKQKLIKNANGDTLKLEAIYPNVTATKGAGDEGGEDRGLKLEFMLGAKKPQWGHAADQTYDGFVGFGTGLVPEGKFQELKGDMEVSFKAKVDIPEGAAALGAKDLDVEFNIQTNQYIIKLHGATYKVKCKFTEEWQTFTYKVAFGKDTDEEKDPLKFYQYNWWIVDYPNDPAEEVFFGWESAKEDFKGLIEEDAKFDQSEKFQWVIKNPTDAEANNGLFAEELTTVYIDDITISNYTPTFDDEIQEADAWKEINDEKAFLIYEKGNANIIGDGNGWYTYDDTKNDDGTAGLGTSEVTAKHITTDGENVGIEFKLGNTFEKEIEGHTVQIFPFVGLAVGMYEKPAEESGYFDYTKGFAPDNVAFNGIQFKYKTNDGLDWVQVRMKDDQNLKADGASFNVNIPGTGGAWKTATVALADLKLPWWDDKDPGVVLNKKAGKTIEFAYEGLPGTTGEIYVDDLKLVTNAEENTPDIIPVVESKVATKATDFALNFNNKAINLRLPVGVSKAQVMLYNVRGQLVSSQIVENGVTNAVISTENLATSTYILRAVSLEGTTANFTKAISVVR